MEDNGNGVEDTDVIAEAVSKAVSAVEEVAAVVAEVPVVVENAVEAAAHELSSSWDVVHADLRKSVARAAAGSIVRIKDEATFNTVKSLLESGGNLRKLVVQHKPGLGHHSVVVRK